MSDEDTTGTDVEAAALAGTSEGSGITELLVDRATDRARVAYDAEAGDPVDDREREGLDRELDLLMVLYATAEPDEFDDRAETAHAFVQRSKVQARKRACFGQSRDGVADETADLRADLLTETGTVSEELGDIDPGAHREHVAEFEGIVGREADAVGTADRESERF